MTAHRKPLARYGAVEGALARGVLRRAPISLHVRDELLRGPRPTGYDRQWRNRSRQSDCCTPNHGSLIILQDPQGRR